MIEDINVHRLQLGTRQVTLIGTAHVSHESAELVRRLKDQGAEVRVVMTAAELMADRLGREAAAEQRLRLMSFKVRGHALETPLRELLERVGRLSAISRGSA